MVPDCEIADRHAEVLDGKEEDARLLAAFQSGDGSGLVKKYQPLILRYFLQHVSGVDYARAEDLAQEAWKKVFGKSTTIVDPRRFRSWLWKMLFYMVVSDHRSRDSRLTYVDFDERPDLAPAPDGNPVSHILNSERQRAVHAVLDSLDPMDKEALTFRYIDGMTDLQIAAAIKTEKHPEGIPLGTAKRRLWVARKRFAERFKKQADSLVVEYME